MATSVRPRRHGRPKVSETITRHLELLAGAQCVAYVLGGPVGVDGEQRSPAPIDVRQVDARVRADEPVPGLADDQVAPPAHDARRFRLDQRAPRVEVVGVERNEPVLGLRHDLLSDDEAIAALQRRTLQTGGVGDEHRDLVAGTDLADSLDRDDRDRHATAASVSAASAAAISGLRIIVSVTTACTPAASTSPARPASTASMTSELQNSA